MLTGCQFFPNVLLYNSFVCHASLDYQIEQKLQQMDRETLLRYIESKGNMRKGEMYKVTVLQTNDWHNTSEYKKKMVEEANRLR